MSTFSYIPDFGAQKQKKPRVSSIKFGDGYEQRVAYGLNTSPQVWSVSFTNRSKTEADAIDAFLESLNGVLSFDWTPPDSAVSYKFKCSEWSRSIEKNDNYSIRATFEQVFDI